ncbi:MAG: tetratricopeptide repeat protein [Candidatus Sericytochromatia bacterium]
MRNPNSFECKLKLSQAYLKSNDFESSIGVLNQLKNTVLEEDELNRVSENIVKVYNSQIISFKREKKYKEAIYTYEEIYKIDNDKDTYFFNLAKTYLENKNTTKAIEFFNQIIENKKVNKIYLVESYYNLGKIEENENRDFRAIKLYQEIIDKKIDENYKFYFKAKISAFNKEYQKAIELFNESIKNKIFLFESYLGIAESLYILKNYNKSIDFYQKSFELNKSYKTLLLLIRNYLKVKNTDEALKTLSKINDKVIIKYPLIIKDISILLFELDLVEEANKYFLIIKNILNNEPEIDVYLAKYLKNKDNINLYNQEIERIFKEHSHNYLVLKESAKYFISINNNDKAIEIYNKMLQTWSKNKEPLKLKAELYKNIKNTKESIKAFEEYISFEKNDSESIYNLGLIYFDSIQMDNAIKTFEKIKDDNKYGFAASSILSDIYISKGDSEKAIKSIEKCLQVYPTHIDSYIKYAKIFANTGHTEKAMGYLRHAQSIEPNNKDLIYFIDYYNSMV